MTSLSVVIPAYNEEDGIEAITDRLLSIRDDLKDVGVESLEVLVVDDGSGDRTAEIAGAIQGVQVIKHQVNRGYGAALKTGFASAKGELIGFLDADGTYPPEYFPKLCQRALNGAELVIGSRMSGESSKMPATRRLGNFIFANLLSLLGPQKVSDSASGMRVFKREILERLYPLPDGLNLTPVMSVRALHENVAMSEVSIPYDERVGRSKLSVVHDGSLFLRSIIWTVLGYNPVRVLGILGLFGVGFGALVSLGLLVARLSGITTLGVTAIIILYAALVSAVSGVSLYTLGATFNYLVSLFHKQPVQQGLFDRSIFKRSLETHFGWMGLVLGSVGIIIAVASLVLGFQGWEMERIWLYLLGAAMSLLIGVQMIISWIQAQVLRELSERDLLTIKDLDVA